MNMAIRAVWLIEMPCSAAASRSCALARSAQPKRVRFEEQPERAEQHDGRDDHDQPLDRQADPRRRSTSTSLLTGGTFSMRRPKPMHRAPAG